ncbi:hypothetical protein [Singulisphaera acidiphila]|uniref:hypothetical protein n=1 Tax=Singulisphaera acidiphila TaxID=466153 RepID=UPI0006942F9A|nr:hypothetical protein [Singulisphaera acidiphila]
MLETTAYHEAGHAVAATMLKRAICELSIVPTEDSLGHILKTKPPDGFRPDINGDNRTLAWIEREVLIGLAGPAAEAKHVGRYDHRGARGDYKMAANLASHHHGFGKVLEKYLDYMVARAEDFVAAPHHWVQIEDLAAAILVHKVMKPKAIREVCRAAMNDSPRIIALGKSWMAEEERRQAKDLATLG